MTALFSDNLKKSITAYLSRYETKRSAILPILHAIQDEQGWIRDEHMEALEKDYGLSAVEVREVVTFYSMYRTEKPAKFQVLFCDNIVCCMMGAKETMAKIQDRIETFEKSGKESPLSLQGVPCLGVCDGAPAMLVNKDRYLRVNPGNVGQILDKYVPLA